MIIDKLVERIDKLSNPSLVGLDPVPEMIPKFLWKKKIEEHGKTTKAVAEAFIVFNKGIIDSVYDLVPAVKPQIAMYERYGFEGIRAYLETVAYAKEKGLIVVGDIKRGDISSTAQAYAGHLGNVMIEDSLVDPWQQDFITVNPYFGIDGIDPFLKICKETGKGIFILVKTSNPSAGEVQDLVVNGNITELNSTELNNSNYHDSGAYSGQSLVYERVGALVSHWGSDLIGSSGYSSVGAVVGATKKEEGAALRKALPHTFFLVPGYGAQGGKAEDLAPFFDKDGRGCLISSSRGITGAYQKDWRFMERDWGEAAREAVRAMKLDLERNC